MRRERVAATACHWYGPAMTPQMNDDQFATYVVILRNGPLSPAEDLETAIVAAAQAQALGQLVLRIEQDGQARQSLKVRRLRAPSPNASSPCVSKAAYVRSRARTTHGSAAAAKRRGDAKARPISFDDQPNAAGCVMRNRKSPDELL